MAQTHNASKERNTTIFLDYWQELDAIVVNTVVGES